jgi:uncharacterized protein with HEPN domain
MRDDRSGNVDPLDHRQRLNAMSKKRVASTGVCKSEILPGVSPVKSGEGSIRAFKVHTLLDATLIHHIQIIGEAASKLSKPFQKKHSDIPWHAIIGMRNVLVHEYDRVHHDIVWDILAEDIPAFRAQIEKTLADEHD